MALIGGNSTKPWLKVLRLLVIYLEAEATGAVVQLVLISLIWGYKSNMNSDDDEAHCE